MRIGCYQTDPACDLFPLMSESDLDDLAKDVGRNGLQSPIVLHHGRILDGRNRLLACLRAGAEPRFDHWRGAGSPMAWLVSMNLHRRHLDTSQRGMIAARALAVFEAEARTRQGRRTDLGAELREGERGKASERAAALVSVGPRTVEHAKVVLRCGDARLVEAVEHGVLSVSAAAAVARRSVNGHAATRAGALATLGEDALDLRRNVARGQVRAWNRFDVLVAFPEWSRNGELERYRALDVHALTARDATVFLATPDRLLPRALRVLTYWGLEYSSTIVVKMIGDEAPSFVNGSHEFILVGTRGAHAPSPAEKLRPDSILDLCGLDANARRDAVLDQIERMFPDRTKVHLFARSPRANWSIRP